jgi:hypothetical protein
MSSWGHGEGVDLVGELTGSDFEGMSDVLRNAMINIGVNRPIELLIAVEWPRKMAEGGEILPSCGAILYATILYANIGGGKLFGGGELAWHRRIEVAASGDGRFWK